MITIMYDEEGRIREVGVHANKREQAPEPQASACTRSEPFVYVTVGQLTLYLTAAQARTLGERAMRAAHEAARAMLVEVWSTP